MKSSEPNSTDVIARSTWRVFFETLGSFRKEYCLLLALSSMLSGLAGILHPLLIKSIFDHVITKDSVSRTTVLIICYLFLGLAINAANATIALWAKSLEKRIVNSVCSRLLRAYYLKDYGFVLKNGYGYFIGRIYGDVRDGVVPLLAAIQAMANQIVLLVALVAALAYLSLQAFSVLVVLIPIGGITSAMLSKKIEKLASQEREEEGAFISMLARAINAFRMVRIFDLVSRTSQSVESGLVSYLEVNYRRFKAARALQGLSDLSITIADFLSLLVGALFVIRGALTVGSYLAFVNSFWKAVNALTQILKSIPDLQSYAVMLKRLDVFSYIVPERYYTNGLTLYVKDLRFDFGEASILNGLSLEVQFGERVLIVGPNGCGKTTLLNVLSGYLKPIQGDLVLPPLISTVTLPTSFPPLKVEDLLQDEYIRKAFSLNDQKNLNTAADELSIGQQHKLALGLALSQEADLYLLDEPFSNLDPESTDIALSLILDKTHGKTLIVVMHGAEKYHSLFDRVINLNSNLAYTNQMGVRPLG